MARKKITHSKQFGQPGVPNPAHNIQQRVRDDMVRILVSQLNEVDKHTGQEKKHLLVERLLAMGIGLAVNVNGKVIKYNPDLKAMKEILDRLIGRAPQPIGFDKGEDGAKAALIIFDEPGDSKL